VIKDHIDKPLIVARTEELVSHAIERMRNIKFTNTGNGYVGICRFLDETDLFQSYVHDKNSAERPIKEIMGSPYIVNGNSIEEVSKLFNRDNAAVLIDLGEGRYHITKYDIIGSIK
jgi:cystathionine beta-synthase